MFWILACANLPYNNSTKEFPRWQKLFRFTAVLKVTFNDGNKFADLSIVSQISPCFVMFH